MAAYQEDRAYGEEVVTDEELLTGEGRELGHRAFGRRGVATGLGLLALAACGVVVWHGLSQDAAPDAAPGSEDLPATASARALLESRVLADTVAESFEVAAAHVRDTPTPDERAHLKVQVRAGLKEASDRIQEVYPEAHARLEGLQLSRSQQGAVLRAMSYMADPRVQNAGHDLMEAAVGAARESKSKAAAKEALMQKLQPKSEELRALREEMFPKLHASPAAADFGRMRLFKALDKWDVQVDVNAGAPRQLGAMSELHSSMMQQAQSFMDTLHVFHGLDMPNVAELDESTLSEALQCVSSNLSAMSLASAAGCLSSYFGSVVDYVKQTFGFADDASSNTDTSGGTSPWG